jgi:hypothetical protein
MRGHEMGLLVDAVLGTPESFEAWRQALVAYGVDAAGVHGDVDVGRGAEDLEVDLGAMPTLRAAVALREVFGDIDAARGVLAGLSTLLDRLEPEQRPRRRAEASSDRSTG